MYNGERHHEAPGIEVPLRLDWVTIIRYPEILPAVEYLSTDKVSKISRSARIYVGRRSAKIGKAFIGQRVALRTKARGGCFSLWFSRFEIEETDQRAS